MANLSDARVKDIATYQGKIPTLGEVRTLAVEMRKVREEITSLRIENARLRANARAPTGTTLTEMLPAFRGNQSQMAADLKVNRGTLRKYLMADPKGEFHRIVGGVFMSAPFGTQEKFKNDDQS